MGLYLNEGLALGIYARKEKMWGADFTLDEITKNLEKEINLDLYNIREDEKNVYFTIKPDIFMDNFEDLLRKEYEVMDAEEEAYEIFDKIKEMNFEEFMKALKSRDIGSPYFQYSNFGYHSNEISYISTDRYLTVYVEMISFNIVGKIVIECYKDFFRYLRRKIIKSIDNENPLKDDIFIAIHE